MSDGRFRVEPFADMASLTALDTLGARRLQALLKAAGCATVVEETGYPDEDHLDAYGKHYFRQYFSMDRRVRRLHYFGSDPARVTPASLTPAAIASYLGYSIIPPVDDVRFGRTVLASRVAEGLGGPGAPVSTCAAPYTVRFGGDTITFDGSPWMEQDGVITECATCAIWTAVCHMAHLFPGRFRYHTPAGIHDLATQDLPIEGRRFPAEGLDSRQIATALRRMGFEPLHEVPDTSQEAHDLAAILVSSGIPVLVGLSLLDGKERIFAYHEVALTGIIVRPGALPDTRIVSGFLVQDDLGGPFRRASFTDSARSGCCLEIDKRQTFARVEHLIAPLPPGAHLDPRAANETARNIAIAQGWGTPGKVRVWTTLERGEEWQCQVGPDTGLPNELYAALRSISLPAWVLVSEVWKPGRGHQQALTGLILHDASAVNGSEPVVICGPGSAIVWTPDRKPLHYQASATVGGGVRKQARRSTPQKIENARE